MGYHQRTVLTYQLPSVIKEYQRGWIRSCTHMMLISCLLAILSLILFTHIRGMPEMQTSDLDALALVLLAIGYTAVLSNCGAAVTALLIQDKFNEMSLQAASRTTVLSSGEHSGPLQPLYKDYLDWKFARFFKAFCIFLFSLGFLSTVTEVMLYMWHFESNRTVKIVISCWAGVCAVPLLLFILQHIFGFESISEGELQKRSRDNSTRSRKWSSNPQYGIPV